ncbi:hypothetical protein O6H91_14G024400 [Diphasiastrum complanatum]|uniref:Uncharacterized protein n=1 Tax=Diphasiastrum complanatum TaxID=34168 RepID=A0ACC2BMB6_DIPCM|nr:hypothetical protein O6H91_14G024400 [Diphasiastrum complanatum]
MYATRLQTAAHDENKMDAKLGGTMKGLPLEDGRVAVVPSNNRRALEDIGNVVGSLSALSNASDDGAFDNKLGAKQMVQVSRPSTRRFVASLSNGQVSSDTSKASISIGEPSVVDVKRDEVRGSWGTKQRRKLTSKCSEGRGSSKNESGIIVLENANGPTWEHNGDSLDDKPKSHVMAIDRMRPARMRVLLRNGRGAASKREKKQTLTAAVTARSEAACGRPNTEKTKLENALPNIDEADVRNALAVTDYVEDIYSFYRKTEVESCASSSYMSNQADINDKMRAILIDWLIEVHLKFKLMPETLFLTINLIDRYLSCENVSRKYLQLVGLTAMLVAAKYEEIWPPEVQDFVFISDNAYTRDQVLAMEKKMLNTLCFNLTVPTPYMFIVRFLKAAVSDHQMDMMAFFLLELSLVEYKMIKFPPSLLAAAAVYTAQCTLQRKPLWTRNLQHHSCYDEEQLRECAGMMVEFHRSVGDSNLTVVHKKYSDSIFDSVAVFSPAILPTSATTCTEQLIATTTC